MAVTSTSPLNLRAKHIILKKHCLTVPASIPAELLQTAEVESHMNYLADQMLFTLNMFVASTDKKEETTTKTVLETVTIPLTWWDHLKLEHAPACFLSRWPAKTRTLDAMQEVKTVTHITKLCPHIAMDQEHKHVEWLATL